MSLILEVSVSNAYSRYLLFENDSSPLLEKLPLRNSFLRLIPIILLAAAFILAPALAKAAEFNPPCGDTSALTSNVLTANSNGESDIVHLASACTYELIATLTIQPDSGNTLIIDGNGA